MGLKAQEVADALHGLQRVKDSAEARGLVAAMVPKVQESKGRFTGRQVGQSLYGLQSLGDSAEVRALIMALIPKVQSCGDLDLQDSRRALQGVRQFEAAAPETRALVEALRP